MRVLVDHGAQGNLGDGGILESAVHRLLRLSDQINLDVRDREGLRTDLWRWERVTPVAFDLPNTTDNAPRLRRVPYLWRYEERWRALWRNSRHALLNRLIDPRRVTVSNHHTDMLLGEFCARYDALNLVGGGYLAGPFVDEVWEKCCLIHAFASQGKPVLLTGQQIGPFRNRSTRWMLRSALRRAAFVGLREPGDSVTFCQDAKLPPERYAVMGDDSLGLGPDAAEVDTYLTRYRLSPGRFLAVNLRLGSYVLSTQHSVKHLARLVSGLARHYGLPLVVVPIALGADDSDIASGHKLKQALEDDLLHVLDDPELSPKLVKGVLGKAYAAVGSSYHFCTFALSQGVPALCTFEGDYYGQKARGLARFWDDDRLSLALDEGATGAALEQATALFEDVRFRDVLRARATAAVAQWTRTFDHIAQRGWAVPARGVLPAGAPS